jgi:cell division protein FtsB
MDTETPIATPQTQLPQVRRVSKLDDVKRVVPQQKIALPRVTNTPEQKKSHLVFYLIMGAVFLGVFGFELAVIYKYDKLNKKLYQISVSLKSQVANLQDKLQYVNKQKKILGINRKAVIEDYMILSSSYKNFKASALKEKTNYENDLSKKTGSISSLEGDLRVANAQAEAVRAQNELLSNELNDKMAYIEKLTTKLVSNINEQAALLKENLDLKARYDQLMQALAAQPVVEAKTGENSNGNK